MKKITDLTREQEDSLRQYANDCKMRPASHSDEWRDVPTSWDEIMALPEEERKGWLELADDY